MFSLNDKGIRDTHMKLRNVQLQININFLNKWLPLTLSKSGCQGFVLIHNFCIALPPSLFPSHTQVPVASFKTPTSSSARRKSPIWTPWCPFLSRCIARSVHFSLWRKRWMEMLWLPWCSIRFVSICLCALSSLPCLGIIVSTLWWIWRLLRGAW